MPIFGDHMIYPYYSKEVIVVSSLINIFANHGSYFIKAKTNSLIHLNFGCHAPTKPIEKNSEVHKLTMVKNLLTWY